MTEQHTTQTTDGAREKGRPELGRLVPPYPVNRCANADCPHDDDCSTFNEHGAYLYRDLDTEKLVVFCGDCARHAELNAADRFKLIAL